MIISSRFTWMSYFDLVFLSFWEKNVLRSATRAIKKNKSVSSRCILWSLSEGEWNNSNWFFICYAKNPKNNFFFCFSEKRYFPYTLFTIQFRYIYNDLLSLNIFTDNVQCKFKFRSNQTNSIALKKDSKIKSSKDSWCQNSYYNVFLVSNSKDLKFLHSYIIWIYGIS